MRIESHAEILELLGKVRHIALVGASNKPHRASHRVMQFLQNRGYRVTPVNPKLAGTSLLGETVVAHLHECDDDLDMVDVFRRSEVVPDILDDTLATNAKILWLQLGVIHEDAAEKASKAGLMVVMDRCPKIELAG